MHVQRYTSILIGSGQVYPSMQRIIWGMTNICLSKKKIIINNLYDSITIHIHALLKTKSSTTCSRFKFM